VAKKKKFNKSYYPKNVIFLLTKAGHFLHGIIYFSCFSFKMLLSFLLLFLIHPAPFKGPF
jgi:hypothetical protein